MKKIMPLEKEYGYLFIARNYNQQIPEYGNFAQVDFLA